MNELDMYINYVYFAILNGIDSLELDMNRQKIEEDRMYRQQTN